MTAPTRLALVIVLHSCAACSEEDGGKVEPQGPFEWRTTAPPSVGLSAAALEAMRSDLEQHGTQHLLVVRSDQIALEWYAAGRTEKTLHYTASLAKALTCGVGLAVALGDGRLSLDDLVSKHVPRWQLKYTKTKAQVRVRHLASHSSGLEDALPKDEPGWKTKFWSRLQPPDDPFTLSREDAPMMAAPGAAHRYSNPGFAMLSYAITASLSGATHHDLRTLLSERVMKPIGVADADWRVGYGQTFTVDGLPLVPCWGGGDYTARAIARVGRLLLHRGRWQDEQLIPSSAVDATTTAAPGETVAPDGPACAPGWWVNSNGRLALPVDAVIGLGAEHQLLVVIPSLDLILVRMGGALTSDAMAWAAVDEHVAAPLMAAVVGSP